MMPAVQDFEQRLGILHQVEPILENAINTLSKVVDLGSSVSSILPKPAPPPPKPKPKAAPASGNIDQLRALLAQAEAAQQPAAEEAEPEAEAPQEDTTAALAATLGGGGGLGGLSALLGGLGGEVAEAAPAAPEPEPAAAAPEEEASLGASGQEELISKLLGGMLVQTDAQINIDPDQEQTFIKDKLKRN